MLHKSVLLEESVRLLNVRENGIYVDATLGYGGHSGEVLKLLQDGHLYAFDQDDFAVEHSRKKLSEIGDNFTIFSSNFVYMKECLEKCGISSVDGILFDLGVSSVQLDFEDRGFSFHKDAKLDMRMDPKQKLSAYEVVNEYSYSDLARILREYGEEKYASSIARQIVQAREEKTIETTLELVEIIRKGMPAKAIRDSHPGRKTFQAIRIEVNRELDVLQDALLQALDLLKVGGRLCVITFHSLEDRIVKNTFRKYSEVPEAFRKLPFVPEEYMPKYQIIEKGLTPSDEEISINRRARSSRLRVIERIKD